MSGDLPPKKIGSLWIGGPLSWIETASISSFLRTGHEYTLFTYHGVPNAPEGTIVRDAREIWANDDIIIHAKANSPAIHADIFRAIMTRDTDMVWADTDIIALRPFPADLDWYIGWERTDRPMLGNAIMGFPKGSETIRQLTEVLTDPCPVPPWLSAKTQTNMTALKAAGGKISWGNLPWGATGPDALSHYAKQTGEIEHAQPTTTFFPVSFQQRKHLTDPQHLEETSRVLNEANSLCVHLYSRWLRKYTGSKNGGLPAASGWLGTYLREEGLVDYDNKPAPPAKVDASKEDGPQKLPRIDPDTFQADYSKRREKLPVAPNTSPHGRVVCITMAKDEGPYVLEWVAYHYLKGFTDILAFSNDCTDGTAEMLDALHAIGIVTHCDNPQFRNLPPQSRALKRAQLHPLTQGAEWALVMDFDEFLAVNTGDGTVNALIDRINDAGATAMPITWRFFGSSGLSHYDERPVSCRLTRAAGDGFSQGFGVKTLFKNEKHLRLAIHRPRIVRDANPDGNIKLNWINGSGDPVDGTVMTWRQTRKSAGYEYAQMNHYGVKTGEEYLMRRLRGDVLNNHGKYDDDYFRRYDRNDIEDTKAMVNAAQVAGLMETLLKDARVAEAAELIKTRFNTKLARLRDSEGYQDQMRALGFTVD